MATARIELRLSWFARSILNVSTALAIAGIRVPHRWVVFVTNRSWSMRTTGNWQRIRIDSQGRVIA